MEIHYPKGRILLIQDIQCVFTIFKYNERISPMILYAVHYAHKQFIWLLYSLSGCRSECQVGKPKHIQFTSRVADQWCGSELMQLSRPKSLLKEQVFICYLISDLLFQSFVFKFMFANCVTTCRIASVGPVMYRKVQTSIQFLHQD